ncbi:MAG: DUF2069 domain-containing protein [Rubrivivax sp.]|jgi:uncharacterized membrane protein
MTSAPGSPPQPAGLTLDGFASGDRLIPDGPPRLPDDAARQSRALTLGSVVALLVLCVAWELWLAPTGSGTLAIKALPLLLPLLGLMRYRLYTFRWLSLLIWLYAGEGLLRLSSEGGLSRWLAVAEVLLSVLVFVGCVWHVRARLRHLRADGAPAQGASPAP